MVVYENIALSQINNHVLSGPLILPATPSSPRLWTIRACGERGARAHAIRRRASPFAIDAESHHHKNVRQVRREERATRRRVVSAFQWRVVRARQLQEAINN